MNKIFLTTTGLGLLLIFTTSCKQKSFDEKKFEQITERESYSETFEDTTANSVKVNQALSQLNLTPNSVLITGLPQHRLLTIYKASSDLKSEDGKSSRVYYNYDGYEYEGDEHYMPGIDILYGYNLLNIAHYDMLQDKTNFLFKKSALIKTLYYPATIQDSINKIPVTRNYYLLSVYDEDTNKDSIISRKDLRKFYCFSADGLSKTQIIPNGYSVLRSQYDDANDAMYIFAKQDVNKNGKTEKSEPLQVFWVDLKAPSPAKLIY